MVISRVLPWVLLAAGLVLIAAGFLAAFSILGLSLIIAGVILTPAGLFLERLEVTAAAPLALLETAGIMALLALLGGALWWLGATVAGA